MTILHDEHKPKATPMTSDAVVRRDKITELLARIMYQSAGVYSWEELHDEAREAYRLDATRALSALSDAGLAVLPRKATHEMRNEIAIRVARWSINGELADIGLMGEIYEGAISAFHPSQLDLDDNGE